jgi:hypothetical protein
VVGGFPRREDEQAEARAESAAPVAFPEDAEPRGFVQELQRAAGNRAVAGMLRGGARPRPSGPTLARSFFPWLPPISLPTFWLASLGVSEASAPVSVTLPKQFSEGLQQAWDKSLPGEASLEHGGILVSKADGTYEWKAGKKSTSGTFSINYEDVGAGETLVASAHTHPYSKAEGGHTNVAFSGGDMANFVTGSERIKVVRSGTGEFMLAKSKEWDDDVKGRSATKIAELEANIEKTWTDSYAAAKGDLPARVEAAVKAVAKKFHLLYYRGTGGALTMPEDMRPKVEETK